MKNLIIDCFAGGGGASVGIEMALGRPVDIAINHDPQAIRIIRVENMEEAVETAHRLAQKGDVVSLSPASASFDLYPNFAARGNHFKQLVNAL